ncbi:hypothetical protein Droror1_Dr00026964, partial [Drosera rotundifolia]
RQLRMPIIFSCGFAIDIYLKVMPELKSSFQVQALLNVGGSGGREYQRGKQPCLEEDEQHLQL